MKDLRSASDHELVALLKGADHAAFTEIYNRYSVPVLYQINQMLRDRESSRDLLQDLFVALWNKPENLQTDANLRAYLYVAARNRVFDLIEKGKVRNDYLSAVAAYASEVSLDTLNELDERELSRNIQKEIDALPPKMREVFELSARRTFPTWRLRINWVSLIRRLKNRSIRLCMFCEIKSALILLPD